LVRICGACRQPLRHDESCSTFFFDESAALLVGCAGGPGYCQACPRCIAKATGAEPPPPRVYPAGSLPPHGAPFPICGLCRTAMFDGEAHKEIRLEAGDVADSPGVEPGGYMVCRGCWGRWSVVVQRRWEKEGVITPGATPGRLL
jgi:hypothetical protein